jgi:hypothetical protein
MGIAVSEVFISWSTPDYEYAQRLFSDLRKLDVPFYEYSEDTPPGAPKSKQILDQIDKSTVAVIFLSNTTVDRPWILTEIAWIFDRYQNGKIRAILPVTSGAFDNNRLPHLLESADLTVYDLARPRESAEGLIGLVRAIQYQIVGGDPIILPAALFALTEAEFDALTAAWVGDSQALARLCRDFGMELPPEALRPLRQRYGPTREHFRPFAGQETLVQVVEGAVALANKRRPPSKGPVLVSWLHAELFHPNAQVRQSAREVWGAGSPLLIVDSLAAAHDQTLTQIRNLPPVRSTERIAVFWVPPFTRRTSALVETVRECLDQVYPLEDYFTHWQQPAEYWRSFDAVTKISAMEWIMRMCQAVVAPGPIQSNVNFMNMSYASPPLTPRQALSVGTQPGTRTN